MWLVLCPASDWVGLWAATQLRRRNLQPLEIVTGEALAYNLRFAHCLQTEATTTEITLADGRVLNSQSVHGVLNRLPAAPLEHLQRAAPLDRSYAQMELQALFLSWLYALPCKVFNRPTPQGLCGAWRHLSEWISWAHQAGLRTPSYQQSEAALSPVLPPIPKVVQVRQVIVLETDCFGEAVPKNIQQGCVAMAQLSRTAMLGIQFQITASGEWWFQNATCLPDLRCGGAAFLNQLALTLQT